MTKQGASASAEAPLSVHPYDNSLRFLVRSEAEPDDSYIVELDDKDFPAGRCDCDDYRYRIEPAISKKIMPKCGRLTCKHIRAVIDHACPERETGG